MRTRPYVTWSLSTVCTALLVRLALLPPGRAARIVDALGAVPHRFLGSPASPEQWITLLASSVLHAGWVHLAGNLLYLLVFGPLVEDRLGHLRFVALWVIAGTAGALAHIAAFPASTTPLVGASGAIAGILAAHLVLEPRSHITVAVPVVVFFELAKLPAAFVIVFWVLLQLVSALAPVAHGAAYQVAWFAHLGGFAAGLVFAVIARGPWRSSRSRRARPRH